MMSEELLPCPFCGGEAYTRRIPVNDDTMRVVDHDTMYVISCMDCDAFSTYCNTKKKAIAAWNRRSYHDGDYTVVDLDNTQAITPSA